MEDAPVLVPVLLEDRAAAMDSALSANWNPVPIATFRQLKELLAMSLSAAAPTTEFVTASPTAFNGLFAKASATPPHSAAMPPVMAPATAPAATLRQLKLTAPIMLPTPRLAALAVAPATAPVAMPTPTAEGMTPAIGPLSAPQVK
ncbi:hypothetical protein D9T17_05105 [Lysobacter enzymogenes]|uniref:Uncharacterized protein n=1 Tax=Lysobacter enzymogenes TaxID=69 RepID=A0A3N2RLC6_LYSEN|nr:hypothetical protein D9T17_05105 [Lysobacter enzymogenes]